MEPSTDETSEDAEQDVTAKAGAPVEAVSPATDASEPAAAVDVGAIRPGEAVVIEGGRLGDRFRPALLTAVAAHGLILAALVVTPEPDATWSGGQELAAIDVDIVSPAAIAAPEAPAVETAAAPAALRRETLAPEVERQAPVALEPDPQPPEPDRIVIETARTEEVRQDGQERESPRSDEPEERPVAMDSAPAEQPAISGIVVAGRSAPGETPVAGVEASPGEIAAYQRDLVAAIARKRPRGAPGQRGTVKIAFTVGAGGAVANAFVRQSSGNARLDEAALQAVREARLPEPPAGMPARLQTYEIPFYFR